MKLSGDYDAQFIPLSAAQSRCSIGKFGCRDARITASGVVFAPLWVEIIDFDHVARKGAAALDSQATPSRRSAGRR